jgi:hypothetical protein
MLRYDTIVSEDLAATIFRVKGMALGILPHHYTASFMH